MDKNNPELYTKEELETVVAHIQKYYGDFEQVFHESEAPDIHVDICLIPPSGERDYYTLVTMGMGAHTMNVPEELAEYKLERAELLIALPDGWKLKDRHLKTERWNWPLDLLQTLARMPIYDNSWLGYGHTVDNGEEFAINTDLCGAILIEPMGAGEGSEICVLPNGEEVNFYMVLPLYREELDYKLENDVDTLLDKMGDLSFVTYINRPNAITGNRDAAFSL